MIKKTVYVAAMAAAVIVSSVGGASALDDKTYALCNVGQSSNGSWNLCDDDKSWSGTKIAQGDQRKCVSRHANNGWGNGGDSTNPGSDNGKTQDTKFPSVCR